MIRLETLSSFAPGTEQLLFPYSADEFLAGESFRENLIAQSEDAQAVYYNDQLLCYAGVVRSTLSNPPFFWLLLGKNFSRWSARVFRELTRMLRSRFPVVYTIVEEGYLSGKRFAAFCGFHPLNTFVEIQGRRFEYYEVR